MKIKKGMGLKIKKGIGLLLKNKKSQKQIKKEKAQAKQKLPYVYKLR